MIRGIFSHAGGAVPLLAGRIASLAQNSEDRRGRAPDGIDFELKRLHYETANSAYAPNMAALLNYVSISRSCFGSDFPYVSVTENVSDLGKLELSAADPQGDRERQCNPLDRPPEGLSLRVRARRKRPGPCAPSSLDRGHATAQGRDQLLAVAKAALLRIDDLW